MGWEEEEKGKGREEQEEVEVEFRTKSTVNWPQSQNWSRQQPF